MAVTAPGQQGTDLTNCDREPIHIPGSIQPHGFLLALRARPDGGLVVETCSENAGEYLGAGTEQVLGAEIGEVLRADLAQLLRENLAGQAMSGDYGRFLGSVRLSAGGGEAEFHAVAFRTDDLFVVEFERTETPVNQSELNGVIAKFVASLEEIHDRETLCQLVCEQVQRLTEFDRVMLYRFDAEGHGVVLAESNTGRMVSHLGQWFPGSDIPRQARALYVLNRTRIIPDVEYTPARLISAAGADRKALDLSQSILRSVSPVHRDYMRNMGTIASMSISIVIEGRLWGLISAHHREPKSAPYLVRSACDVLSRIVAAQIVAFTKSAEMEQAIRLKSVQSQLLTYMAAGENYIDTLVRHPEELFAVAGARGAAIVVGDKCALLGETPSEPEVIKLVNWVSSRAKEELFATSNLEAEYTASEEVRAKASGVLAISLSQVHRMHMLWFRPEVVETVHWAGEPEKNPLRVAGVLQIHPRNSFAAWKQIVRGKSDPWSPVEIESAREFRNAVLEIVLKRAEELADMAQELELANKELEAFSYSVSHDLRAPFRHISGFAELLMMNEAPRLSETGKRHLATIAQSAQFAGLLVDSLLNFSRITRTKLDRTPVRMKQLVEDVWRDIHAQELNGRSVNFRVEELPTVMVDLNLMRQVWRNLLSNAAKYTRGREQAEVVVSCRRKDGELVFEVRDNGVGFDQQFAHKLFGAFQRLHRMEDFEGTGIGLANVRRIVARHNGRTWAEGKEGEGAVFSFSLPETVLEIAVEEKNS